MRIYHKGTLENLYAYLDARYAIDKLDVLCYMNDCHYYFDRMPQTPNLAITYFVTGLQFETLPGTYHLPCSEGHYSVYTEEQENKILMRTNGNGTQYTHANVQPTNTDTSVDFGWIRFFGWQGEDYDANFNVAPCAL